MTNKKTVDELDGKIEKIVYDHNPINRPDLEQAIRELIDDEKDKDRPYIALMKAGIEEQIEEITRLKEQVKKKEQSNSPNT